MFVSDTMVSMINTSIPAPQALRVPGWGWGGAEHTMTRFITGAYKHATVAKRGNIHFSRCNHGGKLGLKKLSQKEIDPKH